MKSKRFSRVLALLLLLILVVNPTVLSNQNTQVAAEMMTSANRWNMSVDSTNTSTELINNTTQIITNSADIEKKDEVLYGDLDANGNVKSIYAVNQFHVTKAGTVVDYGKYSSVLNLTTTNPIKQNEEAITFDAQEGAFYYQGNLEETKLPWSIAITYTLDGKEISASELAGQSGEISIHFVTKKHPEVDPTFYDNYMLQATFNLGNEVFSNIKADGATLAVAGKNTSVNYTVMPKNDADAYITAQVTNFHMEGVQISGIPFSVNIDLSDTDGMLDDFDQLTDAIGELNSGVGDLNEGAKSLTEGATKLENGSTSIEEALTQLSGNSTKIINGSNKIKTALNQIDKALESSSFGDIDSISTLAETLTQMADGVHAVSGGLEKLNTGFQTAYQLLDQAIKTVPDTLLTKEQIQELYLAVLSTNQELSSSLDVLVASYTSALTIKGTYQQLKPAFDAVGTTISTLTPTLTQMEKGLRTMATQLTKTFSTKDIAKQIKELTTGLNTLATNYTDFHKGLVTYMNGVTEVSKGYGEFQDGLSDYSDGIGSFQEGISKLHDGTKELAEETATLPEDVNNKIKEMGEEYSGKEFEPVSFLSTKNEQVYLVQFVLKTAEISLPEKEEITEEVQEKETIWDRFIQLF